MERHEITPAVPSAAFNTKKAVVPVGVPAQRLLDLLWSLPFLLLCFGSAASILPGTFAWDQFMERIQPSLCAMEILDANGSLHHGAPRVMAYFAGAILLLSFLARHIAGRAAVMRSTGTLSAFLDAFCIFSCLFLLDFLLSTSSDFDFHPRWWVFYCLAAFFLTVYFLNRQEATLLLKFALLLCGTQALHAVVFYFIGRNQFYTSTVGYRTSGGFSQPIVLYSLCLLAIPLAIAFAEAAGSWLERSVFHATAMLCLLALILTFSRAAWLGMASSSIVLLPSLAFQGSRWVRRPRAMVTLICAALVLTTALVRTRGRIMDNMTDRSILTRIEIWKIAVAVIRMHPVMGCGFNVFQDYEVQLVTPGLRKFLRPTQEPVPMHAHSLYCNGRRNSE